jgi:hypothetical protein
MTNEIINQITKVVEDYFQGIYCGNILQLRQVFHPRCLLFGDIKNTFYLKDVDEYLEAVKNRKSPSALGEPLRMKVISIDVVENMAYAKVHVPMFEFNYYDYLSLLQVENARWLIVSKLFTHVGMEET